MEKVKTFLADISDLLNEKNYQKIYEKVPAFRQDHILGNMFCAAQAYPERG